LAGTLTLKAAGLETIDPAEIRNTWLEILGQSLSALARSVGSLVGHEVTCGTGVERAPANPLTGWTSVQLGFPEAPLPSLWIAFSPQLQSLISEPQASANAEPPDNVTTAAQEPVGAEPNPYPRTLDLLLDVDLPVSISFGKAQLPMKDVLKLTTGSIVELNRGVNEPVEVLVNHCLIARGEVVVVEGNYGVRIQEIVSRYERLRSLR
jgi:flagellar motor switch protein FliN/FliY